MSGDIFDDMFSDESKSSTGGAPVSSHEDGGAKKPVEHEVAGSASDTPSDSKLAADSGDSEASKVSASTSVTNEALSFFDSLEGDDDATDVATSGSGSTASSSGSTLDSSFLDAALNPGVPQHERGRSAHEGSGAGSGAGSKTGSVSSSVNSSSASVSGGSSVGSGSSSRSSVGGSNNDFVDLDDDSANINLLSLDSNSGSQQSELPEGFIDAIALDDDEDNESEAFFDDDDGGFFEDGDLLDDSLSSSLDFDSESFMLLWEEDGYQPDRQVQLSEYLFDESTPEAQRAKLFQLDTLLGRAIDEGASDVHLIPGDYVTYRVLGRQKKITKYGRLTNIDTEVLSSKCTSNRDQEILAISKSVDVAYTLKVGKHKGRRTRLSVGRTFGSYYMVFRIISENIPSFADLNMPQEMIEWSRAGSGLILMNGPTGSGKTTTLASILQEVVSTRPVNVISLEKPVEYIFQPGAGTVVQRDVGNDTKEFSDGLTAAMRQDPDVIMVGEVRNRVEVDALIEATETGHLTFSTVHASNCSIALHRLSSLYAKDEVQKILSALSVVSRGYINQILVLSPDGSRRSAVRELLPFEQEVRALVEKGDSEGVYMWQFERGLTMEHSLIKALEEGRCTLEEAQQKTVKRDVFDQLLKKIG